MNAQKKKFPILKMLALFMMLVVLPAGSWYYLKQGYEYRKASLDKLQELGTAPSFSFVNYDSTIINSEDLEGNVVIAGVFDYKNGLEEDLKAKIGKLFTQFNRREEFYMIVHLNGVSDSTVQQVGETLVEDYNFEFPERFYLTSGTTEFAWNTYKIPASKEELNSKNMVVLIDAKQEVRNYYSLNDEEEIKLLVHHVTIVLPKKQEKDIIIKRDTEK
jgi:cytochrome oxidase Cu insertion factor (SCO1/SenC/PrrC family)